MEWPQNHRQNEGLNLSDCNINHPVTKQQNESGKR